MASATIGLFDPWLVIVELGLPVPVTVRGLAPVEGAIKITTERRWRRINGCDGETQRVRKRGKGGRLQLILMQSTLSLDALAAAQLVDQVTGAGVFPMVIFDANGNGNRVAWAERAWLDGPPPELNLVPNAPPVVFTLELDGVEIVLGSLRRGGRS